MSRMLWCAVMVLAMLAGCSKPKPPEKDRPVEPQATELRDAIRAPLDKAKATQDTVQEAADAQAQAIKDAGG